MAYKKYILLGHIAKIHGYKGVVAIKVEKLFSENIPPMESVFIEIEGRPVPFFIEYAEQPDSLTLRLKFEGYNSVSSVKEFAGCSIYLTDDRYQKNTGNDIFSLSGYKIISSPGASIGIINDLIQNPSQVLLNVVSDSGKTLLIPFHEDLIDGIDHKKRIIRMIIPEGLDDLN